MKLNLAVIVFVAVCSVGCDNCDRSPFAPSYVYSNRASAWFHPNLGSVDLQDLFREGRENEWVQARSKIEVFQFHQGNLLYGSCAPQCGFNNENNFSNIVATRPGGPFVWLSQQGIQIAFEAEAVKSRHCNTNPDDTIASALEAIRNIESTGGQVSFLSMDEPFTGLGNCAGRSGVIRKTKYFIDGIHAVAPNVKIGLTEAYPYRSVQDITSGIVALEAEGVKLAYLHLDVDIYGIRNDNVDSRTGLRQIKDFCKNQGLILGVIMGSGLGLSNETFFNDVMRTAAITRESIGTPDRLIFESWSDYPPTRISPGNDHNNVRLYPDNLPETKELTHSWVLLKLLEYFGIK